MVAADELSDHLFALSPAGSHVFYEVDLADMVASQCTDCSSAAVLAQQSLQDAQILVDFESALDGEVAIEVCFKHLVTGRAHWVVVDEGKCALVALLAEYLFEMVVGLKHETAIDGYCYYYILQLASPSNQHKAYTIL